jgi:hypothetical protein
MNRRRVSEKRENGLKYEVGTVDGLGMVPAGNHDERSTRHQGRGLPLRL